MRDMLGFASHVEVCGIAGICGICGTDHLLEITPAGLPFLGPPPPNPRRAENGNGCIAAGDCCPGLPGLFVDF